MPNRAARTSLLLGALALVSARLFGLSELFVLGSGMIIAAVVSLVIVWRPAATPSVGCVTTPHHPREGDRVRVDIEMASVGRTPAHDVSQFVDGRVVARTRIPTLRAGERRRLSIDVDALRRGELSVGPTRFGLEDPLSLARRVKLVELRHRVIVHPRRIPTTAPSLRTSEGLLIDALRRARSVAPTDRDFHGVRGYQRGDDVRRVNWKASARRDSLLVNEYEPDSEVVLQVVVDDHGDRHRGDSFDVVARIAASLVDCAPVRDVRVVMCFGGSDRNIDDTLLGLDSLALATTHDRPDSGVPDSPDPVALLARVVVTGRVDSSFSSFLQRITPANGVALMISTEPIDVPLPRGWQSLVCPTLDDFERRWPDFVRDAGRGR